MYLKYVRDRSWPCARRSSRMFTKGRRNDFIRGEPRERRATVLDPNDHRRMKRTAQRCCQGLDSRENLPSRNCRLGYDFSKIFLPNCMFTLGRRDATHTPALESCIP